MDERLHLIGAYASGHAAIMKELHGLQAADLDRAPPGEWSVRQVVHHLADTELFRSTRLRRLLSEDAPLILAFDELRLAQRIYYDRPIEASLAVFDGAVRSSLQLLGLMSEADWSRSGVHSEFGRFSMDDWLQRAAEHLPAHAEQIRQTLSWRA